MAGFSLAVLPSTKEETNRASLSPPWCCQRYFRGILEGGLALKERL
jgi:hypothetical protein